MIISNPNGQRTIRLETKDLRMKSKEKNYKDLTREDFSIPDLEWNGAKKIYFMEGEKIKTIKKMDIQFPKENILPADYIQQRELNEPKDFKVDELKENFSEITSKSLQKEDLLFPSKTVSFYEMAINNMADYLKTVDPLIAGSLNAFELSSCAAIIFCKSKEEIIMDIIKSSK